jgi:glycosyltransferase involved in cell wall biosynthesis
MKILQLTHKPPVPSVDGGCLAMNQISNALLSAGVDLKVVSIATVKHPIINSEDFLQYRELTRFESVFVDTKIRLFKIIKSLVSGSSLQANRFYSKKMVTKLETLLAQEKFDVIILESVFVGNYIDVIQKHSCASIILRVHNVEHFIWKRLAQQTKNPIKKIAYNYLATSLKRFELSLFKKIDGYLPITEVDQIFFKHQFPDLRSEVIPFGIDLSAYHYENHQINATHISLFHIGSMNWQPNKEGMTWFLKNVWEKVSEKHPNLTLTLAGKGNQAFFDNKIFKNIKIFDFVEDAQQFMNEHDIMIVPLLSGSGMRIKIMEGLALGKPVISTPIGAEGIEIKDKENIFIADTPDEMIQTIDFCVHHVEKCEEMGKNARKLIEKKYTQVMITQDLITFIKNLILSK